MILVVLIIFAFLRKLWATAIPSVTVPLSIIATFGVMYFFGYSIDNLSLMALTISVGFVVDDAIVMIENIVRYIEAGDARSTPRSKAPDKSALRSFRSPFRWSPCSSLCCSCPASSDGCSTNSP